MRSSVDELDSPAVTVSCPARSCPDRAVMAIRERGNLPLYIGDTVLAELAWADLVESWETAVALSPADLSGICKLAGERLALAMEENVSAANLTDVVSDAAVLFLTGLRRAGLRTPDAIPACRVSFDARKGDADVDVSAA